MKIAAVVLVLASSQADSCRSAQTINDADTGISQLTRYVDTTFNIVCYTRTSEQLACVKVDSTRRPVERPR